MRVKAEYLQQRKFNRRKYQRQREFVCGRCKNRRFGIPPYKVEHSVSRNDELSLTCFAFGASLSKGTTHAHKVLNHFDFT